MHAARSCLGVALALAACVGCEPEIEVSEAAGPVKPAGRVEIPVEPILGAGWLPGRVDVRVKATGALPKSLEVRVLRAGKVLGLGRTGPDGWSEPVEFSFERADPAAIVVEVCSGGMMLGRRAVPPDKLAWIGSLDAAREFFEFDVGELQVVRGRVLTNSGQPAPGAKVRVVQGHGGPRVACDAEGRFEVALRSGEPQLNVELALEDGGEPDRRAFPASGHSVDELGDLQLRWQ
ncbi:MAG: carboxypeptidase-like regulatory domain-containing protein [Planctomycetota bacterium]|nr:carboxypeptidase-like regulatory domain-containing protein [Planctomycetota bacterium]